MFTRLGLLTKAVVLASSVFLLTAGVGLTPVHAAPLNSASNAPKHVTPGTQIVGPKGVYCEPGGSYTSVVLISDHSFSGTGPLFTNHNGTPYYEDMTFTASTTGTVQVTIGASVQVDIDAFISSAQFTTSFTLQSSVSTTMTDAVTVKSVAPNNYVHAQDGVWRVDVKGHYVYNFSNCTVRDYGTVEAWIPWGEGWNTWIN